MRRTFPLLALILMLSLRAFAQIDAVPQLMNFQGRLAKPDGTPVPNGTYSIRFSLWTTQSGGTEKWSQTLNPVTVRNGVFSVLLDTSTGAADKFHNNLFLEIKVGTNPPLSPRQPLVSVAYAMKAQSVRDGSITGASIANGTITTADLAPNALNNLAWLLNGNANPSASSFLGTTTNHPLTLKVNNQQAVRYQYVEDTTESDPTLQFRSINILGGSQINSIAAGVIGGTLVGGGQDYISGTDRPNRVTNNYGTVVGGALNRADGFSFVGGGYNNQATQFYSTIVGGTFNTASNSQTFIGGGIGNTASGFGATVLGGQQNEAAGSLSFAAGNSAHALHAGSFVWADSSQLGTPLNSTAANQFLLRAAGGVKLAPDTTLELGFGVASKEANAGKIGYAAFTPGTLDIVGAGTNGNNRKVKIWSEGGTSIQGSLNVDQADINNGTLPPGISFGNLSGEGIASKRTTGGNQWGLDFYTAFTNRMSITNSGRVGIGTRSPAYTLHVVGTLGVSTLPFGDYANVQWNSVTKQFYYDSSSRRFKENITPLQDDFGKLLQAKPMTYTRPGAPGRWEIGFIAEEFDALGLKRLVDYEPDGKTPMGINYEKICLYLTAIARQQELRIKALEAEKTALGTLTTQVEVLNALIQRLTQAQQSGQK